MRRKEQDARIEQQRQEKEKAREDAARERARFVASLKYRIRKLAVSHYHLKVKTQRQPFRTVILEEGKESSPAPLFFFYKSLLLSLHLDIN